MKEQLIIALVLTVTSIYAKTNIPCTNIATLEKTLKQSKNPGKILLQMGALAEKMEVEPETYHKNPDYRNICHLKIVKSENFGDFPSYSGYHYYQILKKYPKSKIADDAAFALIYVITEDTYNFSDTRIEKKKLETFLQQYPTSNKAKEAKARIKEIEDALKNGQSPILD
jgi:hypothetical protein